MLSALDLSAVTTFLKMANREIEKKNVHFIGYRDIKYNNKVINAKQALLDIGIIKVEEIWKYVMELKPSECFRISRDRDYTRDYNTEMFEFKKVINKKIVYIKLTINNKGLLCLSFHIDNGGN